MNSPITNPRIIIIGAGPTGIGAGHRLSELGYDNWLIYEKNNYVGGHSSTHRDEKGFLWDEGGHIIFSHYQYFDRFIEQTLGHDYYQHQRESWVKLPQAWVPYPFQNNLRHLPAGDQLNCLSGLLDAKAENSRPNNFKEWITRSFGQGIADLFMLPYNFHVWATPLEKMSFNWIAERVSVVDFKPLLKNVILGQDEVPWGPNSLFKFPKYDGTAAIYRRAADKYRSKLKLNQELVSIDFDKKTVSFRDGSSDSYDYLINAMPLPQLFGRAASAPVEQLQASRELLTNNTMVIGFGLEKVIKTSKCWVYFTPESAPFYRLTFFHNYSPFNVPEGNVEKYSSLMCEVSYSDHKPIDREKIVEQCLEALINNGIIDQEDREKVVSVATYDINNAYPVPTLNRDEILSKLQPWLMSKGVLSRGRFGSWKYEISNMDHCFMQGVEAVDYILYQKPESTWN